MNILTYTEAHHEFRGRLKEYLAREVAPHAAQWEKDHIIPKEAWRKVGKAGFLCTGVDKKYGGLGGDFLYSAIVCEEVTKTCQTGLAMTLHSDVVVPYIDEYGSEELKERFLPGCVTGEIVTAVAMTEPDAGSDLSSLKTTAVEDGDEIILSGSKTFISNGIHCDAVVVAAKDPTVESPYQAMSLYVVEDGTPGFTRGRHLDKMGWHSQDTAELFFNECRIPKANLIGEKGYGFLMLMGKLQQERLCCAMGAVYGARQVVNGAVDYFKSTKDASGKPLSKYQAIQFALVEMETEVKIAETFIDKLIADHMEKKDVKTETSMAKYWTTDLANRITGKCLEMMEDLGMVEQNPLAQAFRDFRIMSIFAGTNEIMKFIIAKLMQL